jgi:hypothetical protein
MVGCVLAIPTAVPSTGLVHLMHSARREPEPDPAVLSLVGTLLSSSDKSKVSLAAEADSKGIQAKDLRFKKLLTASLSVHFEDASWAELERRLVAHGSTENSDLELLVYLELASYDGVDFTISGRSSKLVAPNCDLALGDQQLLVPVDSKFVQDQLLLTSREARSATHILQYHGGSVALCRCRGEFFIVHGEQLSVLQAIDRNTSETMLPAIQQQSRVTANTDAFKRKIRSTAVDGAGYNGRTERHLIRARVAWTLLLLHCFVHALYGVHKKMYSLVQAPISGVVAFALSLQPGGSLSNFRESVMLAIEQKLCIVASHRLSSDAARYKEFVFDMLFDSFPSAKEYKTALFRCCPGDWRVTSKFTFVAPEGTNASSVLMYLRVHLLPYLVPDMPRPFPRQRWMGASESLRSFTLAFIHGLLEASYVIWSTLHDPSYPNPQPLKHTSCL